MSPFTLILPDSSAFADVYEIKDDISERTKVHLPVVVQDPHENIIHSLSAHR